jgi:hypothetical protein
MRTTLDIDPDVLHAAKELATKDKSTAGRVISEMFRRGIQQLRTPNSTDQEHVVKNGIPLMPSRGELVTSEHIRRIMDEEGI